MNKTLIIEHDIGNVSITPRMSIDHARLEAMLQRTLDQYLRDGRIPASQLHQETRQRHGERYQSPGYYLRAYRRRADMTQTKLAEHLGIRQHHLSEMENNKRSIGKGLAKRLAQALDCDYQRLL